MAARLCPSDLTNVNGTLFFAADDGDARASSCGRATAPPPAPSSSRTSRPGSDGSYPGDLTNVNGTLFFAADDGTHGRGAVEERRHRRRHRPGQGHLPRQHRLRPSAT